MGAPSLPKKELTAEILIVFFFLDRKAVEILIVKSYKIAHAMCHGWNVAIQNKGKQAKYIDSLNYQESNKNTIKTRTKT